MLHLLLLRATPPTNDLAGRLVRAGHMVEICPGWDESMHADPATHDAVVVELAGSPRSALALARLTLLAAHLTRPLLVCLDAEHARRVSTGHLPAEAIAVTRQTLLEELCWLATERRLAQDDAHALSTGVGAYEDEPPIDLAMTYQPSVFSTRGASEPTADAPLERSGSSAGMSLHPSDGHSTVIIPDSLHQPFVNTDMPLPVGTVLDKYRIEALLGYGTFAHVYRARHLALDIAVALKVLKKSLSGVREVVEHFCGEARSAIRINHPHVVRIYDYTVSPTATYLVMEWIDGVSLADLITTTGRLSPSEVLRIGMAICSGLQAALAEHTIHRDVKPANILLGTNGTIKLADFGLAKNLLLPPPLVPSDRVVGTPLYMAPEQAFAPDTVDCRSDIYALGATLFHACAGVTPFASGDTLETLTKHRDQAVPDLSDVVPDCPSTLAELIRQMLAKEPARRPAEYAQLHAAMSAELTAMVRRGELMSNGWSSTYLRAYASTPPYP